MKHIPSILLVSLLVLFQLSSCQMAKFNNFNKQKYLNLKKIKNPDELVVIGNTCTIEMNQEIVEKDTAYYIIEKTAFHETQINQSTELNLLEETTSLIKPDSCINESTDVELRNVLYSKDPEIEISKNAKKIFGYSMLGLGLFAFSIFAYSMSFYMWLAVVILCAVMLTIAWLFALKTVLYGREFSLGGVSDKVKFFYFYAWMVLIIGIILQGFLLFLLFNL